MNETTSLSDLLTVKAFVKKFPEIGSEAAVRWQIFEAENNGLRESGAIIRLGKGRGKLLIDVPRYREWILGHRSEAV
jgi:hypothetical protein